MMRRYIVEGSKGVSASFWLREFFRGRKSGPSLSPAWAT